MSLRYLWIMPFICGILGYYVASRFLAERSVGVPSLIGKTVHEAMREMSNGDLRAQIIAEHSSPDLAPGVVFDQVPAAGTTIKSSQPVYLTVTERPADPVAFACYHLAQADITALAHAEQIRVVFHELESHYPRGHCYAQYPGPGTPLPDRTLHCYLSQGITPLRLMPSFAGQQVATVADFCRQQGIALQLFHTEPQLADHSCQTCVVREQKPLAGTIVDMGKPMLVQVLVQD